MLSTSWPTLCWSDFTTNLGATFLLLPICIQSCTKILLKAYNLWIAYCWMELECNRHFLHLFLKGYSQFLWSYGWSFFLLYWKKCEVPKLKMQKFGIQCCWHVHNFFNTLGHVNMMTSNFISAFSQVSWNMELLHLGVRAFCYMENLFNPLMVSLFQAD